MAGTVSNGRDPAMHKLYDQARNCDVIASGETTSTIGSVTFLNYLVMIIDKIIPLSVLLEHFTSYSVSVSTV